MKIFNSMEEVRNHLRSLGFKTVVGRPDKFFTTDIYIGWKYHTDHFNKLNYTIGFWVKSENPIGSISTYGKSISLQEVLKLSKDDPDALQFILFNLNELA